jgi:serine/threonine protein kinase
LEVLRRIAEEEVRRPRQITKAVDRELEALLLKSLAHDPDRRYTAADDLAKDIDNSLTGEPLAAKAPTTTYFLRRRLRRYRTHLAVGCGLLLLHDAVGFRGHTAILPEAGKATTNPKLDTVKVVKALPKMRFE